MKSIFKKIAFVLALAMVVTMLPAKAVSAASSDAPQMYKTLRLYLDSGNGLTVNSDLTGAFSNERYASVWGWRENGYSSVEFASADPSIATVSSKGKVTAVKVGSTTVTATFTGNNVETVTRKCEVTVKRNAAKVGLSAASAKDIEAGLSVGDKLQLTAVRKDVDGNTEWNKTQKVYTTDSLRFKSSDENVFKVTKTTGMITATGAGEATLTVWAVQSEGKDAQTGEYPVGASKEYKIVVNSFSAQATGVKEITVTGSFTDKSEFSLKRGNVSVPFTAEISKDGTTAKLALDTKLRKGTYTVTCGNNSANIEAEDEYAKEIIIMENGKMATTDSSRTTVFVHYDILNQYGESARKTFNVRWTASYGNVTPDVSNGILKLVESNPNNKAAYGTTISIVGVHTQGTNVLTVEASVTAGLENNVGGIEVYGIVKKGTTAKLNELPASFNSGEYVLAYKMTDRLGYAMVYDRNEAENLTFTSLSPLLLQFGTKDSIVIDGVEYGTITLLQGISTKEGGSAKAMATSSKTGTRTEITISIVREQVLDSFIINPPSDILVQGEGWKELGFEAYDKDGVQVTSFRAMNDALNLSNHLYLQEQDDGTAKLFYDTSNGSINATAYADAVDMVTATVKATGKTSIQTVYVKAPAVVSSVRGIGENGAHVTLVVGDSVTIEKKKDNWNKLFLQWYDQYDRAMADDTNKFVSGDKIVAEYKGTAFTFLADGEVNSSMIDGKITFTNSLTLVANGTAENVGIEFSIIRGNETIGSRLIRFSSVSIADVTNFSLSENGKKLENGEDTVNFSVTGTTKFGAVNVPDYYVDYSFSQEYDGIAWAQTITGTAITNTKPQYVPNDPNAETLEPGKKYDFYDLTSKDADGKYPSRFRDVEVTARILDRANRDNLVGQTKSTVKVANMWKGPSTLLTDQVWPCPGYWVEAGKSAVIKANNGVITAADFAKFIKDKYKNNYDQEKFFDNKAIDLSYTVTSYVEAANGLYSADTDDGRPVTITGNTTSDIRIENAEIGDTFVVTFQMTNYPWVTITATFTVGADQSAILTSTFGNCDWR